MEDQGIMALPQGQAMPQPGPEVPGVSPEALAAFEQARTQINPVEFGDELLTQAEKADPASVAEFRRMLDESSLPPEAIDALGQMVDTVLAEPEKYEEIRSRFLAEGVPADFLPEQFDAAFFGALNLALDQLSANYESAPQAFEKGGEVKKTPIASGIAQLGRNGDSQLAHITMSEARMLRRAGGSGTINPATGLREYFIDKVFKSVGKALKSVGKAVSSAVKGVVNGVKKFAKSSIGRIITTVALGFFLGPAAASLMGVGAGSVVGTAISGFVGGFGSSLLAGDGLKTALRNGAIGGITAGAMSGVTGSSFYSPSTMTAGEALSGQFDKFTKGIGSLMGTTPTEAAPPSPVTTAAQETAMPRAIEPPQFTATAQPGTDMASMAGRTATDITAPTTGQLGPTAVQQTPTDFMRSLEPRGFGQQLPPDYSVMSTSTTPPPATPYTDFRTPSLGAMAEAAPAPVAPTASAAQPGFFERIYEGGKSFFNPQASIADLDAAAQARGFDSYAAARNQLTSVNTPAAAQELAAINKAAAPFLGSGARMVGTGILGLAAAGGFKQEPATAPGIIPKETGEDLLKKYPERYAVTPGGARITYGGYGAQRFAKGGIADLPDNFPRKTGPINGPGTGTSDSIPAMLSDGEFVFTAKAVRAMGNGSRRKGAKRMYALMKKLEGRK